jgi:hypothetical protein
VIRRLSRKAVWLLRKIPDAFAKADLLRAASESIVPGERPLLRVASFADWEIWGRDGFAS